MHIRRVVPLIQLSLITVSAALCVAFAVPFAPRSYY